MEKINHSSDDIYSIPCPPTISPMSIPAVLPIPRINYDISFHHNTNYATSPSFAQPLYGTQPTSFPLQEMYPANQQNVVLTNGNPYISQPQEYSVYHPQNVEVQRLQNWDTVRRFLIFQMALRLLVCFMSVLLPVSESFRFFL